MIVKWPNKVISVRVSHSENMGWKTLLWRVLIQLWDNWPKCQSDQNASAKNDRNVSAKKNQLCKAWKKIVLRVRNWKVLVVWVVDSNGTRELTQHIQQAPNTNSTRRYCAGMVCSARIIRSFPRKHEYTPTAQTLQIYRLTGSPVDREALPEHSNVDLMPRVLVSFVQGDDVGEDGDYQVDGGYDQCQEDVFQDDYVWQVCLKR